MYGSKCIHTYRPKIIDNVNVRAVDDPQLVLPAYTQRKEDVMYCVHQSKVLVFILEYHCVPERGGLGIRCYSSKSVLSGTLSSRHLSSGTL